MDYLSFFAEKQQPVASRNEANESRFCGPEK